MKTEDLAKRVEELIVKAAEAKIPDDAMKFSQAACNAANALETLNNTLRLP